MIYNVRKSSPRAKHRNEHVMHPKSATREEKSTVLLLLQQALRAHAYCPSGIGRISPRLPNQNGGRGGVENLRSTLFMCATWYSERAAVPTLAASRRIDAGLREGLTLLFGFSICNSTAPKEKLREDTQCALHFLPYRMTQMVEQTRYTIHAQVQRSEASRFHRRNEKLGPRESNSTWISRGEKLC